LTRYLVVAVLARTADEGARVALVLLALDRTDSAAFGGQLLAALLVPHVLAAPAAGALADRTRHRRAVHAAGLALFGAALAGCALMAGRVAAPAVLAVVFAGGCVAPLLTGGLSSLLRDLVPPSGRARAYGLDAASYNVAGICGPAVAAVLAGTAGPTAATLTLAASVAAGALVLGTLPLTASGAARPQLSRGSANVLWRDRTLLAVTVASTAGAAGLGALPVVVALLDPELAGWFIAALAAGELVGTLAYAHRPFRTSTPEQVVLVGELATALPLAALALTSNVPVRMVLFAVAGLCAGPAFSALLSTRDQRAPAEAHTRVFTVAAGMKITAAAFGAAVAGAAAGLGAGPLLLAVAGCYAVGALSGLLIAGVPWPGDYVGRRGLDR
jgi:predicted MFS family arabinose efflux permease